MEIEKKIFYIALILFSLDFKLQGISIFILYSFCFILKQKRILLSKDSFFLIVMSGSFFISYIFSSYFEMSILKNLCAVVLAYIVGSNLKLKEKEIKNIVILSAVFMSFHGVLNLIYNYIIFGKNVLSNSRTYDIWSQAVSASTGQATKFVPLIAIFYSFCFFEKNKKIKIFLSIIILMIFIYNMGLGGRTTILLLIISLFTTIVYFLLKEFKIKYFFKIVLFILLILSVFYIIYNFDILGIRSILEKSYFIHRFFSKSGQGINEDPRLERKIFYYKHFFEYLWGGNVIGKELKIGHAHELWLDIFDMAGIGPYLCICIYTMNSIVRAVKFYKLKSLNKSSSVMIANFYTIMLLQFLAEPILDGSPKLLILYCFIDGLIFRFLKKRRKNEL